MSTSSCMPLRFLPWYTGGRQQRCVMCNEHVSWCCATCSTQEGGIFALHPRKTGDKKYPRFHNCFAAHKRNPTLAPKGVRLVHNAAATCNKQRKRRVTAAFATEC